jgi:TP901 family phage tail tape measure protein
VTRNIAVVLSANASSFRGQMALASRSVNDFQKASDNAATNSARAWNVFKVATAAAVVAIALAVGSFVSQAAQFETRMRNVNSLLHLNEAELGALSGRLLDLSRRFPQSANQLAEGLYDVVSSGFSGAEALVVLEQAAIGASAGLTNTAVSARGISAVINAYGLAASDAADITDVLFQTVNLGVLTFEELASNLGDFVGTAATAGVPIDDAASALATMTLAGINANEASTALNRTLTAFIDPSDAMTQALRGLGYESAFAALQSEGLHGTMEILRQVTGGNVVSLQQLFPEIRGMRGALALMANEGENYNRVAAGISDEAAREGAALAALEEQQKALNYQVGIVTNSFKAMAIEGGTKLLPMIKDLLETSTQLVRQGWSGMMEILRRMEPGFRDLASAGQHVWNAFQRMYDAAEPVLTVFAALVGLGIVTLFNTLAASVQVVGELLEQHAGWVLGAVTAWALFKLAAAAPAMWAMIVSGFQTVQLQAMYAAGAVQAAAASFGMLQVAVLGIAAGIGAGAMLMQNAKSKAAALRAELEKDISTDSYTEHAASINALIAEYEHMQDVASGGFMQELGQNLNPFADNTISDAEAATHAIAALVEEQQAILERAGVAIQDVMDTTGLSQAEIETAMRVLQIGTDDMGKSFDETAESRQKLVDFFTTTEYQAARTGIAMQDFSEESLQALEDAMKAAEEFQGAVSEAFIGSMDVVSQLGGGMEGVAEEVKRSFLGIAQGVDVSEAAQEQIDNLEMTGDFIKHWYDVQHISAVTWSENIRRAVEMGYDPQLIARVMQAGPEEAAPFLQALVDNNDATFIQMVNDSEAAMAEMNANMIEMARLTHIAMTAESDAMARDLSTAMQISQIIMRTGTAQSAAAIAEELGIGVDRVREVADEYGIVLIDAINPALRATGQVEVEYTPRAGAGGGTPTRVRADGGIDDYHGAQIAKAGDMRLWAEPETGGEAYIPLAQSKRRASVSILNEVARRFGFGLEEFADGGMWDPLGSITSALAGLQGSPGPSFAGVSGFPIQEGAQRVTSFARQKIIDWLTLQKAQAAPALGAGPGWQKMFQIVAGQFPDARLHSGFRPGAITATGNQSYHALGRAVDISPRMDIFKWLKQNYQPQTKELIFSPANGAQVRNGKDHMYTGVTRANHFDHIHWAMAHGGILDARRAIYDQGGWLEPGLTMAYNGTGVRERVVAPGSGGSGGLVISEGAVQVSVRADAGVDQRAFEGAVRRAVEPALDAFADDLARKIRMGAR